MKPKKQKKERVLFVQFAKRTCLPAGRDIYRRDAGDLEFFIPVQIIQIANSQSRQNRPAISAKNAEV